MPRITSLGAGGVVPPPIGDDHFCPRIIVGNVPAGDPAAAQAAPFQYIGDPGDGSGIAAALAVAAGLATGADVCVRPGVYTLGAGILPLTVPAGSTLSGAGASTILRNGTIVRATIAALGNAAVKTMQILLDAAPVGSAGVTAVLLSAGASLLETDISFTVITLDESLTALVRTVAASSQGRVKTVTLSGVGVAMAGVELDGTDHSVEDLAITGLATGAVAFAAGSSRCVAENVRGVVTVGFVVRGDRHVMDGTFLSAATGATKAADLVDCNRCRVRVTGQQVAPPLAGSIGIHVQSGTRNVVNGCNVQDYETGLLIAAGGDRTLAVGNQLDATTSALVDAGTLTEVGHNAL